MTTADRADCLPRRTALVLGAKLRPDGQPTPALRRRAEHAARLWHAGQIDHIVVSGGMPQAGVSEAAAMALLLQSHDIPKAAITQEDQARNTWENIQLSRSLLPDRSEVTLITDRYHAPRAQLMARRQGLVAKVDGPSDQGVAAHRKLKNRLREAAAFAYFLLFGPRG